MDTIGYARLKLTKCLYIYLGRTERRGLGIFTARPLKAGAVVMVDDDGDYYDNVVSYHELSQRGYSLEITLQVGLDAFKLPSGSLDDFTNHSCDPNTGIRLGPRSATVLTLRDIAAHEELTYDYSTYLNNPYEGMQCLCDAANCRGVIGSFNTLPSELQRRYRALSIIGDFVDEPILRADVAD